MGYGLVRTTTKADMAAYVDSGPGKRGLEYAKLQSVQRHMEARMKADEKTAKEENKLNHKARHQYHRDLHKIRQKYNTDNRAAERESKIDRGAGSGGSPAAAVNGKAIDDAIARNAMKALNSPQLKTVTKS